MTGIWRKITPKSLAKRDRKHQWYFAYYIETPTDREDENWYQLFTFRSKDRSTFGKIEKLERDLSGLDAEALATKVIVNKSFRNKLISKDPDLQKIWKRI